MKCFYKINFEKRKWSSFHGYLIAKKSFETGNKIDNDKLTGFSFLFKRNYGNKALVFIWINATQMTSKHSSEVCLIDAGVTSISKLNLDHSLLSLNLHCNLLKYIDGFDALGKLKHLDLSSNSIEVISGLDNLVCLKYLNLSCNAITTTEGLENLR